MALISPAGGLVYHLRATLHRRRRWKPFTRAVEEWLSGWQPASRELLLIGPSGGYCLPLHWLRGFRSIAVLEPDPAARLILRARLGRAPRLTFVRARCFEFRGERLDFDAFARVLDRFPGHAVLFANFLGQLRFLHPRGDSYVPPESWLDPLQRLLEGREWASFHDLYSTTAPPLRTGPFAVLPGADPAAALGGAYQGADSRFSTEFSIELLDHGTSGTGRDLERRIFHWEVRPGWHHWVGACSRQV